MSFTRAKLKRFNENTSCGPPVGAYDPKALQKIPGVVVTKEDRFKVPKVLDLMSMSDISTISTGCVTPHKGVRSSTPSKTGWNKVSSCDNLACRQRHLSHEGCQRHLADEMAALRAELRRKEQEIGELRRQLESSETELRLARTSLGALGTAQTGLEDKTVRLQAQCGQLEAQLQDTQQIRDSLVKEREALMEQLAEGEEEHKRLQEEMRRVITDGEQRLTGVYKRLVEQLAEAEEKLGGLESVTGDCHASLDECKGALMSDIVALKDIIKKLNFQKFEDDNSIRDLKGEVFAVSDNEAQARVALCAMEKDVTVLVSQINCLQVTDNNLNANIRSISQQYEVLENCLGVFEQMSRDRERLLVEKCAVTEERCTQVRQECDGLRQANTDLHLALDKEKEGSVGKSQRLQEMDVMGEVVSRELKEAQEELGRIREENKRRRTVLKSLEQSKQDLESCLADTQDKLTVTTDTHQVELKELTDRLDESRQKVALLQDAVDAKTLECDAVEARAVEAERHLAETKEALERALEDIQTLGVDSAQHRAEIEWLKVEKSEFQSEIEQLNSDLASQREGSAREVVALQRQVDEKYKELAEAQRTVAELERHLVELTDTMETHRTDHVKSEETLRQELHDFMVEVDRLKAAVAEMEENVDDANDKRDVALKQCQALRENNDTQLANCHAEMERLEREKCALERDIATARCALDNLRASEVEHSAAVTRAEEELQRSHDINAELKHDLKSSQHELELVMSESRAHELLLEQEVKESRSEVARLAQNAARLNESLAELTETKDAAEQQRAELMQQLHEKKTTLMQLTDKNDELLSQVHTLEKERTISAQLEEKYTQLEQKSQERLHELERKLSEMQQLMQHQCVSMEQCLERRSTQLREQYEADLLERDRELYEMQINMQSAEAELQSAVHQYDTDLTAIQARHESVITDLRRSFEETTVSRQSLETAQKDMDRWRKMYEALWEKVLPFQEQLEAFEAEKQALLGRTHNAQHEIDKLSREYARLLGHQNQKQKIRHVLKLKEENNALKQQVCSLQDQTRRQQQKLSKLEVKLQSADGASSSTSKRHFDVTKAFKHTKENVVRSPLREGNR